VELKANRRITAGLLCVGALLAAANASVPVARDGALRVGDMVAVLFGGIDAVTGLAVLVLSAIAHGVLYCRQRRHRDPGMT
jgi:hypothetical protein